MKSRLSFRLFVRPLAVSLALSLCASMVHADDWPQWGGPSRLGVWTETGIVDRFPDAGLKVAWRVPIRPGLAGPVVAAGPINASQLMEVEVLGNGLINPAGAVGTPVARAVRFPSFLSTANRMT